MKCIDCDIDVSVGKQRCRSCARKLLWKDPEYRNKFVGRKWSDETKAKLSQATKQRFDNTEARTQLSDDLRKGWAKPGCKERRLQIIRETHATQEYRDKVSAGKKRALRQGYFDGRQHDFLKPSSLEIQLAYALRKAKLNYVQQYRPNGYWRYYDFYLPDFNLLIEVDGEYWHNLPDQKIRDIEKDESALKLGYGIMRVSEAELYEYGALEIVSCLISTQC